MDANDQIIVRAAARILTEYGAKLCEQFDSLSDGRGYTGLCATDAANEIRQFLIAAERYTLIPPVAS